MPQFWGYAESLGQLLGAHLERISTAEALTKAATEPIGQAMSTLILFEEPIYSCIQPLLRRRAGNDHDVDDASQHSCAVMVANEPRWPIRSIVFVAQSSEADVTAFDWTVHLAQAAGSHVTILAVVPPVPAMYAHQARLSNDLPSLLTARSPLGRHLSCMAHKLADLRLEGTLRLRQGARDWQVRRDIEEANYDLVVLGLRSSPAWYESIQGGLVKLLLHHAGRPLLVSAAQP